MIFSPFIISKKSQTYRNRLLSKSLDTGDAFHVVLRVLVAKQLLYPVSQLLTGWKDMRVTKTKRTTITRAENESTIVYEALNNKKKLYQDILSEKLTLSERNALLSD